MNVENYKKMLADIARDPKNAAATWAQMMEHFSELLKEREERNADREVCQLAINHYGGEKQKKKLFEEMGELTQAICHTDDGKDDKWHIAEEIADVQIVLDQMIFLYGIRGEVNRQHREKIKRLEEGLKESGNGCE